ncbi:MAG: helix-turn-helix domain-containing protein [Candidatus Acidiferrum sp.]
MEILTPKEVAEILRVPTTWIYAKTRTNQRNPLPVFKIGRYVRFEKSAVIAWLQSTQPKPKKRAA